MAARPAERWISWTFGLFAGLGISLISRILFRLLHAWIEPTTAARRTFAYAVLLLISGMMFSLDELPGPARSAARLLPSSALADVLRGTLSPAATPGRAWIVLLVWAVATPALASRWFRWE